MKVLEEIIDHIIQNGDRIITLLNKEDVLVYQFLKQEFDKSNATENFVFQFVFRSFYGVDRAGLSPEWKERYFALMQEYKASDLRDSIKELHLNELYQLPRLRGDNSLQFVFSTKLWNMIDENKPIYDSFVATLFDFQIPIGHLEHRIEGCISMYNQMTNMYHKILTGGLLNGILQKFDEKFAGNMLSQIKKLDRL